MAWTLDARIPLTLVADGTALSAALAGGGAALLAEGAAPALAPGAVAALGFDPAAHQAACDCGACGTGRNAAALALDQLFQGRVRGSLPWFTRVVALLPGETGRSTLRQALSGDAVTASRFRMDPGPDARPA